MQFYILNVTIILYMFLTAHCAILQLNQQLSLGSDYTGKISQTLLLDLVVIQHTMHMLSLIHI